METTPGRCTCIALVSGLVIVGAAALSLIVLFAEVQQSICEPNAAKGSHAAVLCQFATAARRWRDGDEKGSYGEDVEVEWDEFDDEFDELEGESAVEAEENSTDSTASGRHAPRGSDGHLRRSGQNSGGSGGYDGWQWTQRMLRQKYRRLLDMMANRIVNGHEANSSSFFYQVGILTAGSQRFSCGGTIIHPQYILTAVAALHTIASPLSDG
ncbi:hypothetical protein CBR_g46680 [Chara braunii]|uniref:Peptidase S1 domain-containing protein n=1 Tax=Chara braunii TaxID=69332 RepID=A0A388M133_CHABU|nr:hypothetical protein CBR_g46680 [Chara braunii]|eukprot:GBG88192.1 hypothetical protein CBR_g46680 [Chara braunii]